MEKKIRKADFDKTAAWIYEEFKRRKEAPRRMDLDACWDDIDRQVALKAKAAGSRDSSSGQSKSDDRRAWMSSIELPLQANALEVLTDDTLRLVFPKNTDWYSAHAVMVDKEVQKIVENFSVAGVDDEAVQEITRMLGKMDQESLDLLVHAVMDYSHKQYDYTTVWKTMFAEGLKYGTYVGRWVIAKRDVMTQQYRGVSKGKWPFLVPCSIRNIFLDDSLQATLKEGEEIGPSTIQMKYQNLNDLKMAARAGGSENGWVLANVEELSPASAQGVRKDHVQLLEFEGDLLIPRSRDSIFVPNVVITVAVGNAVKLVRYRENPFPFRSYLSSVYQRDDADSPYGTSPLIKGRPLQEAATESMNRLMDVACLQAEPPTEWDRNDNGLVGAGGPILTPGASYGVERVGNGVNPLKVGDLGGMTTLYGALAKNYEDSTGVNDPRRGGDLKSHTTALATDINASRSVLRTEEYVSQNERGPVLTSLYQEYWLIRDCLKSREVTVHLNARGVQGHVTINGNALPERVDFTVQGSLGALTKRERAQNFMQFTALVGNLYPLLQQEGSAPRAREIIMTAAAEFGIFNAEKYITDAGTGQGAALPGIPGASGAALADLAQTPGL